MELIIKFILGALWGYGSSAFVVSQMGMSVPSICLALTVAILGGLIIGFIPTPFGNRY